MLKHFPGLTPDYVVNGPDGNGMPWDWWEYGKAFIAAMQRPAD
jgi:hypothetical protein